MPTPHSIVGADAGVNACAGADVGAGAGAGPCLMQTPSAFTMAAHPG